jgi:hypothetical protein
MGPRGSAPISLLPQRFWPEAIASGAATRE